MWESRGSNVFQAEKPGNTDDTQGWTWAFKMKRRFENGNVMHPITVDGLGF